jgi:hypothetical protein
MHDRCLCSKWNVAERIKKSFLGGESNLPLSDILPESCQWNVIVYGECITVNSSVQDYNYNN